MTEQEVRKEINTATVINTPDQIHTTKEMRRLNINAEQLRKFRNNQIKTAKYNWFTFLPLSIVYQFNNYFNVFFLVTAVITSIPQISALDPGTAIGPFLFVLVVSLIREAIEDIKKANYDKLYNNSPARVWSNLTGKFEDVIWKDVHVGNIVKVEKNEVIPCDFLIIKSSTENGYCYLETTNLDGESALKPRKANVITNAMISEEKQLSLLKGIIEVDPPNNDIYTMEGTLFLDDYQRSYFDIESVLLRGGKLKNVEYVYGIVVYTGRDTKIMKNIQHGSLKLSSIDTKLNKIVIYILFIVVVLCIVTTIFGAFFRGENLPEYEKGILSKDYLFYFDPLNSSSNALEVTRIFAAQFIIFNTLVPISLMIAYQLIKGFQIVLMEFDPELSKDPDDKVKILSMGLHEDLGTIKYIFSDKTGTLTRNEMEFKACSIFTKLFDDEDEKEDNNNAKTENMTSSYNNAVSYTRNIPFSQNVFKNRKSSLAKTFDKNLIMEVFNRELPLEVADLNNCPFRSYKEAITEFFLDISLNHNVLTEFDNNTGEKSFTGSNPDEVTLVTSAAELGLEFLDRQNSTITVNFMGQIKQFEILYKFDFSSARLRSSIIVRDSENKVKLYMKGADSVILQKIDKFSESNLKESSKQHLDSFARRGLRTLCYSYRLLGEDELAAWEDIYRDFKYKAIVDKTMNSKLEEHISSIESGLTFLGVTALEDKLQENVKTDLQQFIEAGINVWMITGDKLDTAESIGHSCKLFNDDTEVFKIRSGTRQQAVDRLNDIMEKMKFMEKDVEEMKKRGNNTTAPKDFETIKNEIKKPVTDHHVKRVRERSKTGVELKKLESGKNEKSANNELDAKYNYNKPILQNLEINLHSDNNLNSDANLVTLPPKVGFKSLPIAKSRQVKELNDLMETEGRNIKEQGADEEDSPSQRMPKEFENINKVDFFDIEANNNINNPSPHSHHTKNNASHSFDNTDSMHLSKFNTFNRHPNPTTANQLTFNKSLNKSADIKEPHSNPSFHLTEGSQNFAGVSEENNQIKFNNNVNFDSHYLHSQEEDRNKNSPDILLVNKQSMGDVINQMNNLNNININDNYDNYVNSLNNTYNQTEIKNRQKSIVSDFPKFQPRHMSLNENNMLVSSPYNPIRKDEDINDLSIMNLLMDKNYFENSTTEQFNNFSIFNKVIKKNSMSRNIINNNEVGCEEDPNNTNNVNNMNNVIEKNLENLENVQDGQEMIENNMQKAKEELDVYKFNSADLNNVYKSAKIVIDTVLVQHHVQNDDGKNNLENEQIKLEINNPHQEENLAKDKVIYLKGLKDLDDVENEEKVNKKQKNLKVNIKMDEGEHHVHFDQDGPLSHKTNQLQKKPGKQRSKSMLNNNLIQAKTFTPIASKSSDFQNLFEYYQGKIEKLDKRKKSVFDFKPKKKREDSETTPEEDELYQKNAYLLNFGLIIEGASITHCLNSEAAHLFWRIMKKCRSIVACRCSPLQKADIVTFVKYKSGEVTLAIGDGGNDVNMIKAANVGVGLFGKEGYQAAFNADYAISQFKYLKRLIFTHGKFSLERNSYFIYFFFFKNVMFTLPQFWLCFFSGFSGVNYYDDWYYMGFNSFLTTFPVGAKAIMDEDVDMEFKGYPDREILKFLIPDIYKEYRDSVPFNIARFFFVFSTSFFYSLVIYFIPVFSFRYGITDDTGKMFSYWDQSLSSFIAVIIVHFIVVIEDTNLYTWFNSGVYVLQFLIVVIFMIIHNMRNSGQISGITEDLIGNLFFWFTTLITIAICIVPFFIARRLEYHFSENIINNLRQRKYEQDYAKKIYIKKLEQMTKCKRTIMKFKRLYKQENNDANNYADKRMKEMVEMYKSNKNKDRNKINHLKRSKSDSNLNKKVSAIALNKFEKKKTNNLNKFNSHHVPNSSEPANMSLLSEHVRNNQEVNKMKTNPSPFFY